MYLAIRWALIETLIQLALHTPLVVQRRHRLLRFKRVVQKRLLLATIGLAVSFQLHSHGYSTSPMAVRTPPISSATTMFVPLGELRFNYLII